MSDNDQATAPSRGRLGMLGHRLAMVGMGLRNAATGTLSLVAQPLDMLDWAAEKVVGGKGLYNGDASQGFERAMVNGAKKIGMDAQAEDATDRVIMGATEFATIFVPGAGAVGAVSKLRKAGTLTSRFHMAASTIWGQKSVASVLNVGKEAALGTAALARGSVRGENILAGARTTASTAGKIFNRESALGRMFSSTVYKAENKATGIFQTVSRADFNTQRAAGAAVRVSREFSKTSIARGAALVGVPAAFVNGVTDGGVERVAAGAAGVLPLDGVAAAGEMAGLNILKGLHLDGLLESAPEDGQSSDPNQAVPTPEQYAQLYQNRLSQLQGEQRDQFLQQNLNPEDYATQYPTMLQRQEQARAAAAAQQDQQSAAAQQQQQQQQGWWDSLTGTFGNNANGASGGMRDMMSTLTSMAGNNRAALGVGGLLGALGMFSSNGSFAMKIVSFLVVGLLGTIASGFLMNRATPAFQRAASPDQPDTATQTQRLQTTGPQLAFGTP